MLKVKFIKRNETRAFDGEKVAVPVHDIRIYGANGELVAETRQGYRDKYDASRAWTLIRDEIAAGRVVVEGEVVEEEALPPADEP